MKTQNFISELDNPIIPEFSFFTNPVTKIIPCDIVSLLDIYYLIKGENYKHQTEKLRSINDHESIRIYKSKNLDYVTFSGIFSKRNDNSLIKHSGLLTLDFDHVLDLNMLMQTLLKDKYFETELMFISPSGKGLKWIISIDLGKYMHQEWYKAISAYIKFTYGFQIDTSGKDISRACFLSFDPKVYINPKYLML